jgi:hypothetical protein
MAPLFGVRIGLLVMPRLYPFTYIMRMRSSVAVIKVVPVVIAIIVTMMKMGVIIVIPVVMITVVEIPVIWSPRMPVFGVIAPVPCRMPYHIVGHVNKPYYRPVTNLIISCPDNGDIPGISGVGCFIGKLLSVDRFNNIVPAI